MSAVAWVFTESAVHCQVCAVCSLCWEQRRDVALIAIGVGAQLKGREPGWLSFLMGGLRLGSESYPVRGSKLGAKAASLKHEGWLAREEQSHIAIEGFRLAK